MENNVIKVTQEAMKKRLANFEKDLLQVRTGQASPTILDRVRVDYYGNPTPLNQVASISVPDARSLLINPFEKKQIGEIEKAIQKADLGLSPMNDGSVIRISIPPLTEERRKEIVKNLKKVAEDARVLIRQERKNANDLIKKMEKAKEITEDDVKKLQNEVQKITDDSIKALDQKSEKKEKEILSI